jgi:hypothetical protein
MSFLDRRVYRSRDGSYIVRTDPYGRPCYRPITIQGVALESCSRLCDACDALSWPHAERMAAARVDVTGAAYRPRSETEVEPDLNDTRVIRGRLTAARKREAWRRKRERTEAADEAVRLGLVGAAATAYMTGKTGLTSKPYLRTLLADARERAERAEAAE